MRLFSNEKWYILSKKYVQMLVSKTLCLYLNRLPRVRNRVNPQVQHEKSFDGLHRVPYKGTLYIGW